MIIATFNVNSLKMRLPLVLDYLKEAKPDVLMLQEVKGIEDIFPNLEFTELGYHFDYKLQKTYNGVATISKNPISFVNKTPVLLGDEQARFLEIDTQNYKFINVYVPNGNPVESEKYPYKLNWLNSFYNYIKTLVKNNVNFVVAGDFNIIPLESDLYSKKAFEGDALFKKEIRQIYFKLLNLGLTDSLDIMLKKEESRYTWWDYRNNGFEKNQGLRIDHILLSPLLADKLKAVSIKKDFRGKEKPSDHTIVEVTLD